MVNIKNIQSKMKELEMSKAQLITNSGLTRVTIDKILKGGEVNVSTLEAIAKGLGVKAGFFFEEDEIKQNITGNGNNQGGHDAIKLNGTPAYTQQEHDELIRLQEEIKGLKTKLKDKEDEIQGVKDNKERELAAKDEIIAELKSSLDRVQKMNDPKTTATTHSHPTSPGVREVGAGTGAVQERIRLRAHMQPLA